MKFPDFSLKAQNISHFFRTGQYIIKDLSFNLENTGSIALTGHNGSGKSTTLKILSGLISPVKGKVEFFLEDSIIKTDSFNLHFGFVAPYLELYGEFNPMELIEISSKMRGLKDDSREKAFKMLEDLGLTKAAKRPIKQYSSGMVQRVRFIQAMIHQPPLLFLDEPMSNLDKSGIDKVLAVLKDHIDYGGAMIIASNDDREIELCKQELSIERYR